MASQAWQLFQGVARSDQVKCLLSGFQNCPFYGGGGHGPGVATEGWEHVGGLEGWKERGERRRSTGEAGLLTAWLLSVPLTLCLKIR